VGHHKPAYGQSRESNSGPPSTKTDEKHKPSGRQQGGAEHDLNPPDERWWGLTRFEWIMAVLTFAGVVIAVFTGLIFRKQLDEMRTDQRAWIRISNQQPIFPKDATTLNAFPVSIQISASNIGKTAARNLKIEAIIDYEVNGGSPDFIYDFRPRQITTTGILFPNAPPAEFAVSFSRAVPNPHDPQVAPRFLTDSEYSDLIKGDAYMNVYAEATYVDIFGTEHWTHFCTFFGFPGVIINVTAERCTAYNGVDNN
jgi:hypothetical protein